MNNCFNIIKISNIYIMDQIYNFSISVIFTSELNKLKEDNEQLKIRVEDLQKDKQFLQKELLIYMK